MPITRCPQCHTAFRVVADQLRVRNGLVRCGVCSTVFDGRASLESEQAPVAPPPPMSPFAAAPAAPELPAAAAPAAPAAPPAVLRGRARMGEGGAGQAPAEAVAARQDVPLHGRDVEPPISPFAPPAPAPVIRARDDGGFPAWPDRGVRAEPAVGRRDQRIVAETPSVLRGRADRRQEPAFGAAHPSIPAEGDDDDDRADESRWSAAPSSGMGRPAGFPAEADHGDDPPWHAEPAARSREPVRSSARAEPGRNEPGLRHDDEDGIDGAPADVIYGDARTRYSSATDSGRAPPEFLDQDRIDSHRTWRRLWTWACLLGLLALGAQLVFAYRTSIAIAAPALRPALTALCQAAGCTVGYARRIERISIVSSSLRPPSGAAAQAADDGRSRLVLTVVLRNRYDKEQHWPALMLDLTDLSDTVVARKAILPEAYLPAGTKGPLGPGAEITLTVPIQVAGLQVNGYQLDKFFP